MAAIVLHPSSFSWTDWVVYPDFLIGWLLLMAAYFALAGPFRHLFSDSRPVTGRQLLCFTGAMGVTFLALQGPLHELSDYFLFSAHMVQHLILILFMPPLLLAGIPDWMLRPAVRIRPIGTAARWLTNPIVAFLLANAIFAGWHFPGPYDLMMRDHTVHTLMHLMIMAVGVIMWWPVSSPMPELPRLPGLLQMLYLFVLGIPMMLVAVLITLAGTPMYEWYVEAPRISPLSPLDDQRLGGIIMWVPGALVLWISITVVYFKWSHREVEEDNQRMSGSRPDQPRLVIPRYPQDP